VKIIQWRTNKGEAMSKQDHKFKLVDDKKVEISQKNTKSTMDYVKQLYKSTEKQPLIPKEKKQ